MKTCYILIDSTETKERFTIIEWKENESILEAFPRDIDCKMIRSWEEISPSFLTLDFLTKDQSLGSRQDFQAKQEIFEAIGSILGDEEKFFIFSSEEEALEYIKENQ